MNSANLYVSNNISNNAINEYYDLKRRLDLTKEEMKILKAKLCTSERSERNFKTRTKEPLQFNNKERKEQTMFDEDLQLEYPNYLEPMITAIKHGYESYDDIERFSGINRHNLSVYFGGFYKDLKKENLINPGTKKTQKQAVIDFIGSRLLDNGYSEAELCETKKEPSAQVETPKEPEQNRHSEQSEESNKKPPKTKSKFSFDDPLPKPEEKFPLRNEPLTEQEQKVLDLLLEGKSYKQCCEELFISDKTIKTHVSNIFSKRGYHSLQNLLVCEYQKKITEIEENQAAAQPPKKLDFSAIKEKIKVKIEKFQTEINKYQEKLTAIDLLETELLEEF